MRSSKPALNAEFLQVPEHCSEPHGTHGVPADCNHTKLTFKDNKTVECRSCGRQWKDYGTGGRK